MKYLKDKKYTIYKKILSFGYVFVVFSILSMSFILSAQAENTTTTTDKIVVKTKIDNPLGANLTDIPSFVKKAIEIALQVGVPILVLAIIYTGFLFVQAQGNPTKLTKAKDALTNTLIGGALLLGAFVIAEAIGTTVEEIKSNI
jgi:hypothetical protein